MSPLISFVEAVATKVTVLGDEPLAVNCVVK